MGRTIAIINFPGGYFKEATVAMQENGFKVVWVCINHSEAVFMRSKMSIPSDRVLDINFDFNPKRCEPSIAQCRRNLSLLEDGDGPMIFDIIEMDRMLRHKTTNFSLRYINHCAMKMKKFFQLHAVDLVFSGRDSALQLTSMLVARSINIQWVVPTRLRIPVDTYGFCNNHETDSFIQVKEYDPDLDRTWAIQVLNGYNEMKLKPALKIAAQSWRDTFNLFGPHFLHFWDLVKRSFYDWGNDYSRYTIPKIIRMYIRRRLNMLFFKIFKPWSKTEKYPFVIYALHTQPESSIDVAGAYFSDQISLIKFIARSLPVTHELYVKIHPTDVDGKTIKFYKSITNIPGVRLINYDVDSRKLIHNCDLIFTLTGTIGFEGGLMGKNVITFAKNYYNDLPTVHYCDAPPQLPKLVRKLLNEPITQSKFTNNTECIINFLTHYRSRVFDGEFNRNFGSNPCSLTKKDINTLIYSLNLLLMK